MGEGWVKVARAEEVPEGGKFPVELLGFPLLLYRLEGAVYCTGGICPHQGRALVDGRIEGDKIICAAHSWVFEIKTGLAPFLGCKIPSLETKVENGEIWIKVPAVAGSAAPR
jgi:toluene monooxygenase system ferredoxin subunit